MTKVFISYSNKDSLLKDQVKAMLKKAGFSTYLDVEDIQPAQHLPKKIKKAIQKCDALVAIITENSLHSNWVQNEIGFADGIMPIVPLVVGDIKPDGILTGREYVPWGPTVSLDFKEIIRNAKTGFVPVNAFKICDKGPYEVSSGEYQEILLNVSKGNRILGRIEEQEGEDFDWYIVDEANLVDFKNSEDFDYEDSGEKEAAYTIEWPVRRKGPWYLVIEAPRRQIMRLVTVHLRRE